MRYWKSVLVVLAVWGVCHAEEKPQGPLCVSGVYPHLAFFNSPEMGECGIGGVVPWAGKLWSITYPPHLTKGSPDKLFEIDDKLNLTIRPESVGGTHACRLIHRESKQLIIGPYFIDEKGSVRAANLQKLTGRMTAIARHLTDPANLVYFIDMEGAIYEVNVHTLDIKRLFEKPVPGWHGKGGYSAQGRLVISNNGEHPADQKKREFLATWPADDKEAAGVLAEWDGKTWRIVERRQFCEVTGPGGIYGNEKESDPLWATGWDKRSVILKLLDGGQWSTFRLPKASHAFDPKHGWYTEWPRIREVRSGMAMMTMHGMMYDFPLSFSKKNTAGIAPICSHLRYVTDFCDWNGRLVVSSDDTSIMQNPMAGLSHSNMWFVTPERLRSNGPRAGWGGVWVDDAVKAGEPSVPFLFNGFERRIAHLAHNADGEVNFTFELDEKGDGQWRELASISVPAKGYRFFVFPGDAAAQWIRIKADKDCTATAYFHYSQSGYDPKAPQLFATLADAKDADVCAGLIRPGKETPNLQWVATKAEGGAVKELGYFEVDEKLAFTKPQTDRSDEVKKICALKPEFAVDAASVIMTLKDKRYRLPKGDAIYDKPFAGGYPRCIRECESERYMVNVHGTFYEMPRDQGLPLIKPVASHNKQIMDFCTWRGLLVLSGTKPGAKADGQFFAGEAGNGLWFGAVDDLYKLGKPVGKGGPWLESSVKADEASDPYLMTGYDKKQLQLSHDSKEPVEFTLEVDIDHQKWLTLEKVTVPPGAPLVKVFPDGYSAHWIRVRAGKACKASATFTYD
ncbi:MAG TPA: hypothetical protein VGP72_24390 [Planctomycetota bacterium]|jgi:hypothetical protein